MKKEEKLYRDFCRENRKQVKKILYSCLQFNDGSFEKALKRINSGKFFLLEDERFRLLQLWKGRTMNVERAIVLANYLHTPLITFDVRPLFSDYRISKYGVFYKEGGSIYKGTRFMGTTHSTLEEWVKNYEKEQEEMPWS